MSAVDLDEEPRAVVVDRTPPQRGWFRRRRNRRVPVARPSVPVAVAGGARWLGRKLLVDESAKGVVPLLQLTPPAKEAQP